ncbi:hypothetical protein [Euzebya sp.]|uniref:hypothetical protein n=1 Tax=Euzebya sp. TaxID=1971409 RepID=UPI003516DEBC
MRLSGAEVEQVIARAIELQQRAERQPSDGLTLADVQDIAAQIGVDPAVVRRAVTDVRLTGAVAHEPSATERLLGPRHVGGAVLVPGDVVGVRAATRRWMGDDEHMRCTGTRGATDRWQKDQRLMTELRRGLSSGRGSGVLRDLREVAVTVAEDPEGTIVTLDADTAPIRTTAAGVLVTTAVSAVGAGAVAAGLTPDTAFLSSDVLQFAAAFAGTAAVGFGTAALTVRTWTRKVRTAVDHALDGITMSATQPELPRPPKPSGGWRRTVADWLGG